MSSPIITVENLSKHFMISHGGNERYTALRDVIANNVKGVFKKNPKQEQASTEEFWALKDINFTIDQGDRLGIVGRNGAGKSTLLKVLSRITEPSAGRIKIKGRVASLLEVGTGFHPELTGRENVFLNGAILGMSRAEIRNKFDEIVAFAEVEKFLDTPVKRYSSGMYVRLAFAVAAHLEPEILIVDEVLAVGDAQFQKKCLGKMQDVSKNEGRTVLFVSHNMGVIAQLCNKGLLLNKGQIEKSGDIEEVVVSYIANNTSGSENGYVADPTSIKNKKNYFNKISISNQSGLGSSDFSLDESIRIGFEFTVKEMIPNLQIGIGIQDKLLNRVTTILQPISFFSKNSDDVYTGHAELPGGIIAPNSYSLVFALWAKDVAICDLIENVCPFKIHDNGSDFAVYEGLDYGHIIIKPNWSNV